MEHDMMEMQVAATMPFDGYTLEIRPDKDGYWLAYLLELPNVSAVGKSPDLALGTLQEAYGTIKNAMSASNSPLPEPLGPKEFSGQFNVRVGKSLHKKLALEARREKLSMNAFVSKLLTRAGE